MNGKSRWFFFYLSDYLLIKKKGKGKRLKSGFSKMILFGTVSFHCFKDLIYALVFEVLVFLTHGVARSFSVLSEKSDGVAVAKLLK
jgi:hypothetical protein